MPTFKAAIIEYFTDNAESIVINCIVKSENFIFPQNLPKVLCFKNKEDKGIEISGTNVDWYSSDKKNYSGCQFIVNKALLLKSLIHGIPYGAYVNFKINENDYTECLDPSNFSVTSINQIHFTNKNNQLFIEIQ